MRTVEARRTIRERASPRDTSDRLRRALLLDERAQPLAEV
jgi:hypothetical protein